MTSNNQSMVILYADDDPEDRMLIQEAFEEIGTDKIDLHFVEDGEDLMHYLNHEGQFSDTEQFPVPDLILLDLNMPKKDGREALKEIKDSDALRHIPVVVLTTSNAEEDIQSSYSLGVSSFITKPVSFGALVETVKTLGKYWFEIVQLPQ
ncbi:response regulator [Sediminitomix flava]